MIVYKDYVTFTVLGQEIGLISDELDYGRSTVAEMNDKYYYMGNEYPTISTAIFAWQESFGRDLTNEELKQVMRDNHLISDAI
jgi:hypothetical protein